MSRFLIIALVLVTISCSHRPHHHNRGVSAVTDQPVPHNHGGMYSFNPAVNEYEYTPNAEDIIARHSFIMLGSEKKIGYHVSFFESRHQHQVILKMNFTQGNKPLDIKKLPNPKNGFISATVAAGNDFPLFTIGTKKTTKFPVTFFDGIIGGAPGNAVATAPTTLTVEQIYHFNRMYTVDTPEGAQYMAFKNDPKKPNEYILAHMIQGLRENNGPNYEQIVIANVDGGMAIDDGSILVLKNQDDENPIQNGQKLSGAYFRKGFNEKFEDMKTMINFTVAKQIHNREVPIDAGQPAAKKKLGL